MGRVKGEELGREAELQGSLNKGHTQSYGLDIGLSCRVVLSLGKRIGFFLYLLIISEKRYVVGQSDSPADGSF